MVKALQFISNETQSFDNNYLLVGDNDFLYLFIKNQIVKKSQKITLHLKRYLYFFSLSKEII